MCYGRPARRSPDAMISASRADSRRAACRAGSPGAEHVDRCVIQNVHARQARHPARAGPGAIAAAHGHRDDRHIRLQRQANRSVPKRSERAVRASAPALGKIISTPPARSQWSDRRMACASATSWRSGHAPSGPSRRPKPASRTTRARRGSAGGVGWEPRSRMDRGRSGDCRRRSRRPCPVRAGHRTRPSARGRATPSDHRPDDAAQHPLRPGRIRGRRGRSAASARFTARMSSNRFPGGRSGVPLDAGSDGRVGIATRRRRRRHGVSRALCDDRQPDREARAPGPRRHLDRSVGASWLRCCDWSRARAPCRGRAPWW